MILLHTTVVSEAMKPAPHPPVRDWLDAQAAETVFLSSVTMAELPFAAATVVEDQPNPPVGART